MFHNRVSYEGRFPRSNEDRSVVTTFDIIMRHANATMKNILCYYESLVEQFDNSNKDCPALTDK